MSKNIASMEIELPPTPPMDLNDSNSNSSNDYKVSLSNGIFWMPVYFVFEDFFLNSWVNFLREIKKTCV